MLVEDHAAFRQSLAALLEREPDLEVVAQAGSLAQARQMLDTPLSSVGDLGNDDLIGYVTGQGDVLFFRFVGDREICFAREMAVNLNEIQSRCFNQSHKLACLIGGRY